MGINIGIKIHQLTLLTIWLYLSILFKGAIACIANCCDCTSSPAYCDGCCDFWGTDAAGDCFSCTTPHCKNCYNNKDNCRGCSSGWGLVSGSGSSCLACQTNCALC